MPLALSRPNVEPMSASGVVLPGEEQDNRVFDLWDRCPRQLCRWGRKTNTTNDESPSHPAIAKSGRTTIRRNAFRELYRFEEVRNKAVDCVEFYTCGEYHALDVRFQDKTSLVFEIEPSFTLRTDHSDWKTGNWRGIKTWPRIRSRALNP